MFKNGKISIKIFKKLLVSIDFSTKILINSLSSGVAVPETLYKCIFLIFRKFFPNFRGKIDKNLENLVKNCKFSIKFIKNSKFFIDFINNLEHLRRPGASYPGPPTRRPPHKPFIGEPRFPPPEKFLRALMEQYIVLLIVARLTSPLSNEKIQKSS